MGNSSSDLQQEPEERVEMQLGAGQSFGEEQLFGDPYKCTYRAAHDTNLPPLRLLHITQIHLQSLVAQRPNIMQELAAVLSKRKRQEKEVRKRARGKTSGLSNFVDLMSCFKLQKAFGL